MKRNEKKSRIHLKKMQIAQITDLSKVRGGVFMPLTSSNYPTCTFRCKDIPHVPEV